MKTVLSVLTFAARHLLIVPFGIIAGCILWTIAYVLLLAVAVIWNQGIGGPLAYPAGILAIIGASIFIGWGIFAPASAIGAIFCAAFRLPRLAAIPVVFGSAFVLSFLLYQAYIVGLTTHSMPSIGVVLKNYAIFLSVFLKSTKISDCFAVTGGAIENTGAGRLNINASTCMGIRLMRNTYPPHDDTCNNNKRRERFKLRIDI